MDFCSHVSCLHSTSVLCDSNIIWSLNKLTPAILMLPINIPDFFHLLCLSILLFRSRADPFVRFLFLFCSIFCPPVTICSLFFSSIFFLFAVSYPFWVLPRCSAVPLRDYLLFFRSTIICGIVVAHAQRGAFPLSTPAGL